ncbi:MAG: Multidrug resistance protein MdtG [Candidatus Thorarchaeota archaeon]|nr:MAG: Multidrug resistance protein MdtG [Candidatus Thorarchaeota archaeon]
MAIYISFGFQSTATAISWQFITYFVKHDLQVSSFLLMTLVWSAPAVVTMVASNLWGSVSDKKGRRKPFMIMGFVGYAATYLMYSFIQDWLQFLFVSLVGSFFYAAALPIGQAYLTTDTKSKGERLGSFLMAQSAGWFIGALGSGYTYDFLGMFMLYRIAGFLSIGAVLLCIIFVRDIHVTPSIEVDEPDKLTILKKPGMKRLVGSITLSSIGINSLTFVLAILIVDELKGNPAHVGLANSLATFFAVLIASRIGRAVDQKGPINILLVGYSLYMIIAFIFATTTDPMIATLSQAIPVYPFVSTAAYSMAAMISGKSERGRAMGVIVGGQNAGNAIGPIIGGLFAEYIFGRVQPIAWIYLLLNFIALLLALSLITISKELHENEKADEAVEMGL